MQLLFLYLCKIKFSIIAVFNVDMHNEKKWSINIFQCWPGMFLPLQDFYTCLHADMPAAQLTGKMAPCHHFHLNLTGLWLQVTRNSPTDTTPRAGSRDRSLISLIQAGYAFIYHI